MEQANNPAGSVTRVTNNGICEITFFHPKGNSLPRQVLYALASEIESAGADRECNVIVLRSHGDGAFCAGASFDELLQVDNLEKARAFFSGFAKVIMAMKNCPKFIVARVHAKVVGGGAGLVSSADYALATNKASVRLSELAIGIGPFTIGPAVLRRIGTAAFHEMAVSADWRSAEWAKERGFYAEVFENEEKLDNELNKLCEKFNSYSPEAMKAVKRMVWEGTDNWEKILDERVMITSGLVLTKHAQDAITKAKAARG